MRKMNQNRRSTFTKLATVTLILLIFIYAKCPTVIPPESGALPPDPGEAGKATIAGIDSDNDGVRDELQRYIALTYPGDEYTQKALTNYVTAYQDFILELDDKEATIKNAEAMKEAMVCVFCARRAQDDAFEVLGDIEGETLNTADRILAYLKAEKHLGGMTFAISPSEEQCAICQELDPTSHISQTARTSPGKCPKFDISIYFVNGMLNFHNGATASMKALQDKFGDEIGEEKKIKYDLSYNSFEIDPRALFVELLLQKGFDDWRFVAKYLNGLMDAPEWIENLLFEAVSKATAATSYVIDSDLRQHINNYKTDLLEGKKVVLVAHSQGNFYANEACSLINSDSIATVAVATPAHYIAKGFYYTTLERDKIIKLIPSLPANTKNSQRYEWTGHSFIKSYLEGDISGPKIINQIRSTIEKLKDPIEEAHQGIITVTLTWGSQPDVDLHVYEPDGSHVFYGYPQGTSGYLDIDDTSGYGPEHYYAKCENLQTGTYRIGVNYYDGDRPETAVIQVRAHNQHREYKKLLASALGPDGDNSPTTVADVIVTLDERGYFKFDIKSY